MVQRLAAELGQRPAVGTPRYLRLRREMNIKGEEKEQFSYQSHVPAESLERSRFVGAVGVKVASK